MRFCPAKKYLLLISELFLFLADDALSKIFTLIHVCWVLHCNDLGLVFFVESDFHVSRWCLEQEVMPCFELGSEWDCEFFRAILQVIVVILVLLARLNQGNRLPNRSSNLVQHKSWTLIQDEGCLSITTALPEYLSSNHQDRVDVDHLAIHLKLAHCFPGD